MTIHARCPCGPLPRARDGLAGKLLMTLRERGSAPGAQPIPAASV